MGQGKIRFLLLFLILFLVLGFSNPIVAGPGMSTISQLNAAGVGNGEVYAGGDFLERRLAIARDKLNQSLTLLRSGFDSENLCSATCQTTGEASLCHALRQLAPAQTESCRKFIMEKLGDIERLNSPSMVVFHLSTVPVLLPGGRPVSAMTKPGEKEPVIFHYGSINNASFEALIALIGHELGHKIKRADGTVILDEKPVAGFKNGRHFLDAVGAALAIYSLRNSAPTQAPPPLPSEVDQKRVCALGTDSQSKYLVGLSLDVSGQLPLQEALVAWKANLGSLGSGSQKPLLGHAQQMLATEGARKEMVRKLFRKHLLRQPTSEEMSMMLERVGAGIPYEAIVASLLGDDEYASARGAQGANQFLNAAFLDLLGRTPSFDEIKTFMDQMKRMDRASIALNILKVDTGGWKKWVKEWYLEYYNRAPSDEELADHLKRLKQGAGWEAVKAFLLSNTEYFTLQSARWPNCKDAKGLASTN